MEPKEAKKYFSKWFKGLKAYKPKELIEQADYLAGYWALWIRTNAQEIGKLDKEERKKRREEKKKRKEKTEKKNEVEE